MSDKIGEKSFLKKCEASLKMEEKTILEKKDFISERKHSIIRKLVNNVVMSFKSNSVQVVSFSVLGFCAGVMLTCLLITSRRPDTKHGVGGLETTAEPEYEENLSSLLADVNTNTNLAKIEVTDAENAADSAIFSEVETASDAAAENLNENL